MRSFLTVLIPALLSAPLSAQDPLPGTDRLVGDADFASEMVAGIDRFLLRELAASVDRRARFWKRDTGSPEAYAKSVSPNRERFRKYIGAVDTRAAFDALEYVATTARPARVGRGDGFNAFAVRWPVFRNVHGEGLLLVPTGRKPAADVVAIPDADQTPEMIAGLQPGLPAESQFARRLAENGCRVVVPLLMDRTDTYSVSRVGRTTNQPHREFVYRPAFEMGRHVIGYEVQKILSVVDWFRKEGAGRVGVVGYAEGGLLALYAGALDPRIDATCVSGYFDSRQNAWLEPIYRNVWGLLEEFGDAEVAGLIAPRTLIIENAPAPAVIGPPKPRKGRRGGAAPGRIVSPNVKDVTAEFARAEAAVIRPLKLEGWQLAVTQRPLSSAILPFFEALTGSKLSAPGSPAEHLREDFDPQPRLKRQLDELIEDTQVLMRESPTARNALWSKADRKSVDRWEETTEAYRRHFYEEVIGRFDRALLPPKPRTRKVYDEAKYTGYEVKLDVFPDVFAYGLLLVPKSIGDDERRPVVVCQHGLEGRPQHVADPRVNHRAYNQYACRLAERGFVVFAPQNPYIFRDRFRTLQRKANLIRKTLFSIIVPQHQQITDWLASLPFVDPKRIGFYGLSYGGKTAMRVPPLVRNYALSICSADFNEWIWKNVTVSARYSYVTTGEYEIFEFDLGNTYNYAEMAGLIAPRPFMVERGHRDGVAPDEWVAYEYAKVRRLYAELGIPGRTRIEFFNGPHTINGKGTFEFLHRHLDWPAPK